MYKYIDEYMLTYIDIYLYINRNYDRFVAEARRCYLVKTKIVPIVLSALGIIPKSLAEAFETLGIQDATGSLQKAALLSTAAILRHFMSL